MLLCFGERAEMEWKLGELGSSCRSRSSRIRPVMLIISYPALSVGLDLPPLERRQCIKSHHLGARIERQYNLLSHTHDVVELHFVFYSIFCTLGLHFKRCSHIVTMHQTNCTFAAAASAEGGCLLPSRIFIVPAARLPNSISTPRIWIHSQDNPFKSLIVFQRL